MVRCGSCGDELPRAGFSSSQFSKPPGEQLCRTCAGPLPALGGAFWREAEQGPQRQAAAVDVEELIRVLFADAHMSAGHYGQERQEFEHVRPVWRPHGHDFNFAQRRAEEERGQQTPEQLAAKKAAAAERAAASEAAVWNHYIRRLVNSTAYTARAPSAGSQKVGLPPNPSSDSGEVQGGAGQTGLGGGKSTGGRGVWGGGGGGATRGGFGEGGATGGGSAGFGVGGGVGRGGGFGGGTTTAGSAAVSDVQWAKEFLSENIQRERAGSAAVSDVQWAKEEEERFIQS